MGNEDLGQGQGQGSEQQSGQEVRADAGWRGVLDPSYQAHKGMTQYADTPEGLNGLVKSFISGQEMIGSLTGGKTPVFIPGEGATAEEVAAFHEALGVPREAAAYKLGEVAPPQGLPWKPEYDDKISGWALQAKLTPGQASMLKGCYMQDQVSQVQEAQNRQAAQDRQEKDGLVKEWGAAMEGNLRLAARVVDTFIPPGGNPALGALGRAMLADAQALRFLVAVGRSMSEDTLKGGREAPPIGRTPAEAQRRATEIRAHKGYMDKGHPQHQELIDELALVMEDAVK